MEFESESVFESESELEPVDKLRRKPWIVYDGFEVGWRPAKKAVMEAEREVQKFVVPWADAWARAEDRAWVKITSKLAKRGSKPGGPFHVQAAQALSLAEAWGEARARARGERVADSLTDPRKIAKRLSFLNKNGIFASDFGITRSKRERNIGASYNSLHPPPAFRSNCSTKSSCHLDRRNERPAVVVDARMQTVACYSHQYVVVTQSGYNNANRCRCGEARKKSIPSGYSGGYRHRP